MIEFIALASSLAYLVAGWLTAKVSARELYRDWCAEYDKTHRGDSPYTINQRRESRRSIRKEALGWACVIGLLWPLAWMLQGALSSGEYAAKQLAKSMLTPEDLEDIREVERGK